MDRLLQSSRYFVLLGVVSLVVASIAGFCVTFVETVHLIIDVAHHLDKLELEWVYFIRLIDGALVSTGLLMFGLGLFELCLRPLPLPAALVFNSFLELKASLANIIILTLAVSFLAAVQEYDDAVTVFLKGFGIAAVIAVLTIFARGRDTHDTRDT
jgi:uncharacterized membrane protein YqhA